MIGIIGALAALLLPMLNRAHESAQRVMCAANLRQIHAVYMTYAMENRDRVPIGYRVGRKQFNSMVYSGTSKKFCLFGILFLDDKMKEPSIFFCPSNEDRQSMFDSDTNPWPPDPVNAPTQNVYAGYGCRPEVELLDEFHRTGNVIAGVPVRVPRLVDFKSKAIFADLVATPARVDQRHRQGVNVLYGDGAVVWAHRDIFDEHLKPCTTIDPVHNERQRLIWASFDREHGASGQ